MIHYYLITRDPGHDVEIQPFKPSASTLQKLTERPIFTGKRDDSKFTIKLGNKYFVDKKKFDNYLDNCIKYHIPV